MKKSHRIISIILCAAMLTPLAACSKNKDENKSAQTAPTSAAQQQVYTAEPASVTKTETVYVNLDSKGGVAGTKVTDWIHTDIPQVKVTDETNLKNPVNIKTNTPALTDGTSVTWNMDTTDLYYSGETEKKPPVDFEISYSLDGKALSANEIAGKSGKAEIKITVKNNCFKEINSGGKKQKVYLPLLVIGGTILPESGFSAVKTENGLAVGDGTKQLAVMAAAPGLCESLGVTKAQLKEVAGLDISDTFVISADATEFELTNIYFAAIPFCSLDLDFIAPNSVRELTKNLENVKKVFSAIENLDVDSLIKLLSGNLSSAQELVSAVDDALALYDKNKILLEIGAKYATEENLAALKGISEIVSDKDFAQGIQILSKSDLTSLTDSLPLVSDTLSKVMPLLENDSTAKALELLSSPVVTSFFKQLPALSSALESLSKIAGDTELKSAIEALSDPSVAAVMNKLPELMKSAQSLAPLLGDLQKDMSDPQVKAAIDNLPQTMQAINKLIKTVDKNKELIDKLISLASDKSVKELIDVLNSQEIDTKQLSEKFSAFFENADEIAARAKEWVLFGQSYGLFTISAPGQKTNVLFIFNTEPIEKPVPEKHETVVEKTHWYDKILKLFSFSK